MWPAIAMAALGAAQYYDQSKKADNQRKLQAETARYSPWTNMQANTNILEPSLIGTVGSGAVSGMQMNQSMNADEAQKQYHDKLLEMKTPTQGGGAPPQGPMTSMDFQQPQYGPEEAPQFYGEDPVYFNGQKKQGPWNYMAQNNRR